MESEHHEEDEKDVEHKKVQKTSIAKKLKKNPWILSTLIFGIVAIILLIGAFGGPTGQVSKDIAGNEFVEFINSKGTAEVELISSEDQGSNLYKLIVSSQGQEVPVYITKDGKYYVPTIYPIVDEVASSSSSSSSTTEISKSDNPKIELFVMTHCPYGTQAEKGFIPFMEAVGDSIDAKIRFVHYYMHKGENQEPEETPRQVCIREEQSDKYLTYLRYFLEEGNYEYALSKAGIDVGAMNECISSGRADEYYAEDAALSEEYGVQGSPTLVVDGKIVSSGRSAAAYLTTACQAFNDAPSVCSEELDSATPTPMWGWDASGTATTAQC